MMHTAGQRHFPLLILAFISSAWIVLLPGCGQTLPPIDGKEVTITAENFQSEVMESDLPVLLDFWAEWCGPCRELEPVVAHLSVNYEGRLKVGKVNIDEQGQLVDRFAVTAIPKLVLFHDGELVATRSGYDTLPSLSAWLDGNLPPEVQTTDDVTEDPGPTGDQL